MNEIWKIYYKIGVEYESHKDRYYNNGLVMCNSRIRVTDIVHKTPSNIIIYYNVIIGADADANNDKISSWSAASLYNEYEYRFAKDQQVRQHRDDMFTLWNKMLE